MTDEYTFPIEYVLLASSRTPPLPPTGTLALFLHTDGLLYIKDPAGTTRPMAAPGGPVTLPSAPRAMRLITPPSAAPAPKSMAPRWLMTAFAPEIRARLSLPVPPKAVTWVNAALLLILVARSL